MRQQIVALVKCSAINIFNERIQNVHDRYELVTIKLVKTIKPRVSGLLTTFFGFYFFDHVNSYLRNGACIEVSENEFIFEHKPGFFSLSVLECSFFLSASSGSDFLRFIFYILFSRSKRLKSKPIHKMERSILDRENNRILAAHTLKYATRVQ